MPRCRIDLTGATFRHDVEAAKARHPSVVDDLSATFSVLEEHFDSGAWIPGVGAHVRKIRVGVKRSRISKRDGYRLIYHIDLENHVITPLFFHYKPGIALIPPKEIIKAMKEMVERTAQTAAMQGPSAGQSN